jgi:hypothetical protein
MEKMVLELDRAEAQTIYGIVHERMNSDTCTEYERIQLLDIKAVMVHEETVLGNGDSIDEVLRNLIQPHVVALETHLAVGVLDLLKKTGDHERCDGRIENGTEKHLKN